VAGNAVENRDRKSSILILDDDFDIVTVIILPLQQHCSFDVYAFIDPALALEHFKVNASKYKLVIFDIRMPQMRI
jgi:PleD family two-component response regulator